LNFIEHSIVIYSPEFPILESEISDLENDFEVYIAKNSDAFSNLLNTITPKVVIAPDSSLKETFKGLWLKPEQIENDTVFFIKHHLNRFETTESHYDLVSSSAELKTESIQASKEQGKNLPELVGTSPAISQAYEIAKKVAPSQISVHLHGETGTGKEMMARVIHQISDRSNRPMVIVNCSALNPQLLESELFGHEKGAFTGATQRRIGRIEEANGSSLFLDEIGEIDHATQIKLLRVLSDKTLERVGGNKSIPVDFRLITATHQNLEQLVAQGKFREDLFYRIHVVKIEIPPLRERGIDIISLTKLFLEQFAVENSIGLKPPTEEVIRLLLTYRWPGNVRQLKAAIEHALVFSENDMIQVKDLPENIQKQETLDISNNNLLTVTQNEPEDLNLENMERKVIKKALTLTSENRVQAAKLLGISRRTLYRKIEQYEL